VRRIARGFFAFWYDFVFGDDWRVALGVAVALLVTWLVSRAGGSAWWVLPVAFAFLLPMSLWRAVRSRARSVRDR
jgi:hypothetical protein